MNNPAFENFEKECNLLLEATERWAEDWKKVSGEDSFMCDVLEKQVRKYQSLLQVTQQIRNLISQGFEIYNTILTYDEEGIPEWDILAGPVKDKSKFQLNIEALGTHILCLQEQTKLLQYIFMKDKEFCELEDAAQQGEVLIHESLKTKFPGVPPKPGESTPPDSSRN